MSRQDSGIFWVSCTHTSPSGAVGLHSKQDRVGLEDPVGPGSSLDSMTSHLGHSG